MPFDIGVDESVRTALLSMSQGLTTIEVPAYAIEFFNKMNDIIAMNPTERQLTGMLNRLYHWEEKVRQQN